ncbi:CYTH domain-containing protein [Staphylococcus carnosus]|uniref:CYTH domain-containing protein n=2 Tax=Staphylococcus carnosus TaxID=1281 RepID=B9DIS0_STACT|nr:CYTH domain-containing protein [Staphylococcus carnosus]ANZ33786.1 adenylate cyclase [Staphylococcus carnosus]KKB24844.1 adenylate cyclase [Staphylococcus carnosus]KOR14025.1 adenylate cyclase [Staphylococcus carnosus]PNZ99236.1 adenylate cyclase [Staphylococcus carnosus]QPT03692.1 CYTH domain-containing protein [Staphylococcus carnosus]
MAINQEIEYKQLLSEDQYNEIKKAFFSGQKPFTQTNFYIDTPNFELAEQLMALRIRQIDNNYEMTLKVPAKVGLTEYNHETEIVPEEGLHIQPEQLPDDIYSVLQKNNINFKQLDILGSLTTHRIETKIKEGLLVLDHSEYLDTEDYELEFEVENPEIGLKKFQEILKEFNIKSEIPKNKVARFFEAKSK